MEDPNSHTYVEQSTSMPNIEPLLKVANPLQPSYTEKRYEDNATSDSYITYRAELGVAEFRKHPAYSMYHNWSRLLVLGIIPFSLLVFFNSKIYTDINERRKRRRLRYFLRFYWFKYANL